VIFNIELAMNKAKKLYVGQSLIESVVTLGVVLLLVTGIVVGTTSSLRYAENSKARSVATQFAQEGLEIARNDRDMGWSTFARSGTFCVDTAGVYTAPPCAPIDGRFTRQLIYSYDQVLKQVTVETVVSWVESAAPTQKEVRLQTMFTKWK